MGRPELDPFLGVAEGDVKGPLGAPMGQNGIDDPLPVQAVHEHTDAAVFLPREFPPGTSQSLENNSPSGDPLTPIFFSVLPLDEPLNPLSTMKAEMPFGPASGFVLAYTRTTSHRAVGDDIFRSVEDVADALPDRPGLHGKGVRPRHRSVMRGAPIFLPSIRPGRYFFSAPRSRCADVSPVQRIAWEPKVFAVEAPSPPTPHGQHADMMPSPLPPCFLGNGDAEQPEIRHGLEIFRRENPVLIPQSRRPRMITSSTNLWRVALKTSGLHSAGNP